MLDLLLYFAIAGKVTGLSILDQLLLNWRTALACALVYPLVYALQTPPWWNIADSAAAQAVWLLIMLSTGIALHAFMQGLLWVISGRPHSIEVVFLAYLKSKFTQKEVSLS